MNTPNLQKALDSLTFAEKSFFARNAPYLLVRVAHINKTRDRLTQATREELDVIQRFLDCLKEFRKRNRQRHTQHTIILTPTKKQNSKPEE